MVAGFGDQILGVTACLGSDRVHQARVERGPVDLAQIARECVGCLLYGALERRAVEQQPGLLLDAAGWVGVHLRDGSREVWLQGVLAQSGYMVTVALGPNATVREAFTRGTDMLHDELVIERPERDDFGQEKETLILAHVAMLAARDGYRCLAQALLNSRRLFFDDPGDYLGDRVQIGVDRASSHWVLLHHLDVVAGYVAAATGKPLMDLRLLALGVDLMRVLCLPTPWRSIDEVAGDGPCGCRVCTNAEPAPVDGLPVSIITGRRASRSVSLDEGAMRRDLQPVIDAGGVRVFDIGFSDLAAAGKEALGILLGLGAWAPGILLFERGGDLQAADYQAFRAPLEQQLEALIEAGWSVGAAMGHSHPEQGEHLRLEWTERTASVAAERLIGYRQLMRRRAELHAHLRDAITRVDFPDDGGEPRDYAPTGIEYLNLAGELTLLELELPAPFLRTLRWREASGVGAEVVRVA